jgi:hypothetical protein
MYLIPAEDIRLKPDLLNFTMYGYDSSLRPKIGIAILKNILHISIPILITSQKGIDTPILFDNSIGYELQE